jgi:hypothetical protein
LGFNENHGYYKPILVNIIPKNYKGVLTKWLNGRKKPKAQTRQDKILAWCKRLSKLTGCSMDDATQIANQKLEYQELKIAEMEDSLKALEKNLNHISTHLEGYEALTVERGAMRKILEGQIDMLYAIFMSSALPQYQKDEVGEKIQSMREELASYEEFCE